MRGLIFAGVFFAAVLCFTQRSAQADTFGDCNPAAANAYSNVADDTVVGACTNLIRSGTLSVHDLAEAYDRRGLAYDRLHQFAAAVADYNEALRLDPESGHALNNRGVVFKDQKKYALAIADFTKAAAKLGLDPLPYVNRARTYWAIGNLAQADTDFVQAIAVGGSYDVDNYISRSDVLAAMGRHADAIAQLGVVIQRFHRQASDGLRIGQSMKNHYAAALNDRCFERGIVGDLGGALSDCSESLALRTNDSNTLDSKAFVEYKLGRFKDTVRDERAALQGNRTLAEAYYLRGLAEKKLGLAADASSDLRTAAKFESGIAIEYAGFGIRPDGKIAPVKDVSKFCRNGYKDPIVKCSLVRLHARH